VASMSSTHSSIMLRRLLYSMLPLLVVYFGTCPSSPAQLATHAVAQEARVCDSPESTGLPELEYLAGLAIRPAPDEQTTWRSLTPPAPLIYVWPEHRERPERTEPPDGEGSGESPMFGGLVYGNSSPGWVTVDSGASGANNVPDAAWLRRNLNLNVVSSIDDLVDIEPFPPTTLPIAKVLMQSDPTRHRANPSSRRIMELHCGQRRS
jgi:hypothetical protein